MIKTINLSAGTETEVELTGGCHVSIENRGNGVIYASKSSGITADSDGVTAIDSGNAKVLRNVAQYRKNDDNKSYDYYGKIYLLSDSDTKAEIQTANDLNFFSRKNSAKGGETIDAYTKAETDIRITEKVAEIVADAPEDFDTLKEMSDWIAGHENDAAAMNSAIQTNANNISSLQTEKVGFTDYASTSKAGIVKVNNTYGTGMNNNTLELISATEDDINAGSNDWKPITPYKVPKVMKKYGINSETQITEMQEDIANKVENDIFVAENLIKYPYESEQNKVSRGVTFTYDDEGTIHLVGTGTSTGDAFALVKGLTLYGTYTISADNTDAYIRVLGVDESGGTHLIGSVINGESTTFTIGSENENVYPSYSVMVRVVLDKIYDTYFKPMFEIGNVAHAYQPYKLSRKAMRDDINALMALLP